MTSPDNFKDATQNNLKTLTNAADATMHHLGELTQLLIEYNGEVVSALNRTVMASMNNFGPVRIDTEDDAPPPPASAPVTTKAKPARGGAAKTKRKAARRRKA